MNLETKSFPVAEVKTIDADKGIIEAYVSVFNNLDYGDDIVRPGFFKDSLADKLPKGVWMHDITQPVAKTLEAYEVYAGDTRLPASLKDLGGLYVKGAFNLDTQRGREAFSDLQFGTVDEFSFGYQTLESNKLAGNKRELLKGIIYEWSPVTIGMNPATVLVSAKSLDTDGDDVKEKVDGKDGKAIENKGIRKLDYKGLFAEVLQKRTFSLYNLYWILCDVLWQIEDMDEAAEELGLEYDYAGECTAALAEFSAAVLQGLIAEDEAEDAGDDTADMAMDDCADYEEMGKDASTVARKHRRLELGKGYGAGLQLVDDAVKDIISRTKARIQMRQKEGRMLSAANETMLGKVADALETHAGDIRGLLDSNAKDKGDPKSARFAMLKKRQAFLELEAEAELVLADVA